MTTKDEALKLALEALDELKYSTSSHAADDIYYEALAAIRQALAEQPAQEDPCPGCRKGGVCRTPKCGRLKLPVDHPLRSEQPAQQQEPVTVLPDGSAFAVMSYPLPKDHWLYADRQYNDGEYEPVELGKPVLTHELRDAVVSAVRYAIRGATNCGKEVDFDPDALVRNAVYALCGPFTSPPANANAGKPWVGLTDEEWQEIDASLNGKRDLARIFVRAIEAKLREKNA